jgi:hypothetical protein
MVKIKELLGKLAVKISVFWNSLPSGVQIIVYLVVAGLMTSLEVDLGKLQLDNAYVTILVTGANNLIAYYLKEITKKVIGMEQLENKYPQG